jgi:lipoprotein-anchoring transpeptidase ErfK/SrfK
MTWTVHSSPDASRRVGYPHGCTTTISFKDQTPDAAMHWPSRRFSLRARFRFDEPGRAVAGPIKAIAGGSALAVMALSAARGTAVPTRAASVPVSLRQVTPVPVPAAQMARLPVATTFTRLRGAPQDSDPFQPGNGLMTHPTVEQVVYTRPGGRPVAVLPTTELRNPTWVPVVQTQPGWERVLLPSRPNRSTGWIYVGDGGLRNAHSAYRVHVGLTTHRLTVFDAGRRLGSWSVAVGAPSTPTPTGRTFLLASLSPTHPTFSPLILPLGAHSASLDTFGGGPGTVALHGWPGKSVFGHAVSHGCVRVPPAALRVLTRIPLGSPVMITI